LSTPITLKNDGILAKVGGIFNQHNGRYAIYILAVILASDHTNLAAMRFAPTKIHQNPIKSTPAICYGQRAGWYVLLSLPQPLHAFDPAGMVKSFKF